MIKTSHLACVLLPLPLLLLLLSMPTWLCLSLHITKDAVPRDVGTGCSGELRNPHRLPFPASVSCRMQFVPGEDELLTPRRKG